MDNIIDKKLNKFLQRSNIIKVNFKSRLVMENSTEQHYNEKLAKLAISEDIIELDLDTALKNHELMALLKDIDKCAPESLEFRYAARILKNKYHRRGFLPKVLKKLGYNS